MAVPVPAWLVRNSAGVSNEHVLPKVNVAATTAPTVNDDSGDGYTVGSSWYDVTADATYFCQDDTLGAAVWKKLGSGAGSVTSVDGSGGTTGLTLTGGPITGSGTLTLGGTLALANGGTGASLTDPNADRILFWDDSAGAVTWLTASTGLSITGTTLTATATGTVTSVALSLPSFITVSGSPVTTSGTLTGTLATQTANYIFAGPTTGAAAAPTFRAMVTADIPDNAVTYAKLPNVASPSLLGRSSSIGTGNVTELVVGQALVIASGTVYVASAGDSSGGVVGCTAYAIQSDMETATSNTLAVTPGRVIYSPYALKKSASFNGTGTPAFLSNVGFSSITDNGTGNWTLNFSGNMSSGNYSVHVSATAPGFGASARFPIYDTTGSTSVQVLYGEVQSGGTYSALDRDEISVTVIGDM